MPANPAAFEAFQADGRKIQLHIRGDEWFNWHEDLDGYTVVRDHTGRYAYAQLGPDNRLVPTPLTVGVDNPKAAGLQKRILPPPAVIRSKRLQMYPQLVDGQGDTTTPQAVPPSGTVKNLVILCKFSDHTEGVHTRPAADYDVLFNQIGGDPTLAPTGSVKDLYLENSYGQMTLESTVVGWVTLPNTETYYANGNHGLGSYPQNAQKMVEDALEAADPLIDFSQFDNDGDGYIDAIDIIHSGYGAETGGGGGNWIWSHRWGLARFPTPAYWLSDEGVRVNDYHTEPALWGTSGTNIVRFGVIAHETGHFFGLPDLYDTDGSGEGIGSWGLMANSWGFNGSQLNPPHFCAWSKVDLGWITPTVIDTPGVYTLDQYATNPQVYRIDSGYPSGEYLLIENRQPAGIESAIPQGGLAIFHIDDSAGYNTEGYPGQTGWPENGNHYRVAVLQADGNYNLEKNNNRGDRYDVYHAGGVSEIGPGPGSYPNTDAYQDGIIINTGNRIHSISASGATMSFTFGELANPQPPTANDVNETTDVDVPVTITLDAADDGQPGPLDYVITSLPSNGVLSDPGNGVIASVPYSLVGYGNQVTYTPNVAYTGLDSFQFKANDGGSPPDGGDSNIATVSIDVLDVPQVTYSVDLETDPGWTYEGQWAWGVPTGQGGARGNPDPSSGRTGSSVIGYNLDGDYPASLSPTQWVTTSAIDCSQVTAVELSFYRWLNVDSFGKDDAVIEVSSDGSNWVRIWQNDSRVTDSSWVLQTVDISAVADGQATVYVRWGMGPTNNNQNYSGWNIDDVQVWGMVNIPQQTLTVSSSSGGSVTVPGEGAFEYSSGSVVNIDAAAEVNHHFVEWTGTAVDAGKVADSNAAATTVTVDNTYTLQANFAIDTFTLDYAAGPFGMLTGDTSQVVAYGGSGTAVTAVPDSGYYFVNWSDASLENPRTDVNVTAPVNVTANFAHTPVVITGVVSEPDPNVPVGDVLIMTDGEPNAVTDPNGVYALVVDYGWSGTVTPFKAGFTFEPNSITYTDALGDPNANFTAILDTFIISGYAVDAATLAPLDGVQVVPDNDGGPFTRKYYGAAGVTDANGFYEVLVDYGFSGDVVPAKDGYVFEPNGISYSNVTNDIAEPNDYAGTLLTYIISGYVTNDCNVPVQDVLIQASSGGGSDSTDPNGFYQVWVDYNWSGTVTVSKPNYTFDPDTIAYTNVLGDWVGEDYVATNLYDLNCDGSIEVGDLAVLCGNWLLVGPDIPGDFHKDPNDIVNLNDFAVFSDVWGD